MVESTADPAFAVDGAGLVVAWNCPAEALFGLTSAEAVGRHCGNIVRGVDECGPVCSPECSVRSATMRHHPVSNFDLQVRTPQGMQWCNISTMHVHIINSTTPYSVHIIRGIDMRKRMELLMRDFIVNEAKLPAEDVKILVSTTRSPSREVDLTERELEVLRLLATGAASKAIAEQLHISRITVNNHIQHILKKLNAHSRLEAVRRAERAGLV